MKPRVVLRADAGRTIGFGHFVRTVALAAYLRDDFDCVVVSYNPEGTPMSDYQRGLVAEAGAKVSESTGVSRGSGDRAFLDLLRPDDIVVLDNYFYSTEYQTEIRRHCRSSVCIDDMHDRHFTADVVMTFCPLTRQDFSLEERTLFFGGIRWSFLREPFLAPAKPRIGIRPNGVRKVVMAMGGADPFRLTDKMIAVTREVVPDAEIEILAGQTVVVDTPADDSLHIWRQVDAARIARLFDEADFGIFPASTVCVEAFARRLPIVAGHYVDNQEEFYAHGVREGWFAPLGCLLDEPSELRSRLSAILAGPIPTPDPAFDFAATKKEIIDIFKSL